MRSGSIWGRKGLHPLDRADPILGGSKRSGGIEMGTGGTPSEDKGAEQRPER